MENPQRWLTILSLFDWIACWYEALIRAWIKIEKYLASEIDEPAMQIAMKNHPDIIQIWDVKNVKGGGEYKQYRSFDLMKSVSMIFKGLKDVEL